VKATAPDRWQRGTAIGGLVSVLLVAVGLYLTNDFNRDQYALQQDSNERQQELALNGQRADRFVKAIDQLGQEGNDKLGIRLGGIYALETLMRDSPNDEDTIIEVLCAFVRTHAARRPPSDPERVPESPVDVRAALQVLGRRPEPDKHQDLDFSNALLGLQRIDLNSANLAGADLRGADLTDADLPFAVLDNADLDDADLASANLIRADLEWARLGSASLSGANLFQADLLGAHLEQANLKNARLQLSDLREAKLARADLSHASLFSADLRGANLRGANLTAADLAGADLTDVDLSCTTMTDATTLPPGVPRSDPAALKRPECHQ
jgi:uncharacterized protein YjbI with pentapeptide repeats